MRAVRSVEVVEAFPFARLCFEIDIAFVAEQLVELLPIRPVSPFHLTVQLRRAALDVGMADAKILDMPMEFGLEFMAIIRLDFTDAEWELFNDMINKVDRIGLCVLFVNLQRPNPRSVIDGGVLEAADLHPLFANESQELNIHLDVMSGNLLLIALGVDRAHASAARKVVQPMAALDTRHRGVGQFDVVIALQIPDDPHRAQMVLAPKIKYLSLALRRRPIRMPLGNGWCVDRPASPHSV